MLTWIFAAILFLGGVAVISAKEQVWKLTAFSNQVSGRASERTKVWDVSMTGIGVVAIILAIILILAR